MFIDNEGDPTLAAQELKAIADAEGLPPSEPSSISSGFESDLANLRLQDDSDSSFFSIHTSTAIQNGKGAFASRDIRRGDLILSEKRIFDIPTNLPQPRIQMYIEAAVQNLSPADLDGYLSLHNSHSECSCSLGPLLGIFNTNGFAVSDDESPGGIFLRASRFNHSCSPNAKFSFNSKTGMVQFYALGTIPCGEEIFITYIDRETLGRRLYVCPRQTRQATLRTRYHFTCACPACSLSEAESKISDARRQKLNELVEFISHSNPFMQGVQLLNVVVEAIRLQQEEGYLGDADDFTNEGGLVCAFHSDWVSCNYWTGLTYHTRVAEFGEDFPGAAEARKGYLDPMSLPLAGLGPPMDLTWIRV